MSIMFTGDWHWDLNLYGKNRNDEIQAAVEQLIHEANANGCKTVFITGDIMDAPKYKGPAALEGLAGLFSRMYRKIPDLKVIALKGNHDWDGLKAMSMFRGDDFQVIDKPAVVTAEGYDILAVPYLRRVQMEQNGYAAILEELAKQTTGERPVIAVLHAALEGTVPGLNEETLSVDALERCGARKIFMGHIHKHCEIMKGYYYTGSLVRCNFGEEEEKSGLFILNKDGSLLDIPIYARALSYLNYDSAGSAISNIKEDVISLLKSDPDKYIKVTAAGGVYAAAIIEEAAAEAERALGLEEGSRVVKVDYSVKAQKPLLAAAQEEKSGEVKKEAEEKEPLITEMKERLQIGALWREYCGNWQEISGKKISEVEQEIVSRLGGAILEDFQPQDIWRFLTEGNLKDIEALDLEQKAKEEPSLPKGEIIDDFNL